MSDLISRQTAIDAVQGVGRLATLPDNDAVVRMSAVEYVLFNLPSAQQVIVQCRDCRFCHKSPDWKHLQSFGSSIWYCGKSRGLNSAEAVELDDYCSSAERKTDEQT